jgi:hypothetical protein
MRHETITTDIKTSNFKTKIARAAASLAALAVILQGFVSPLSAVAALPTTEQLKENASKSLEEMSDFKDENFSMKYPASWEKETTGLPQSQIMRAKTMLGAVNLIVIIDKSENAKSLDNFAQINVTGLKEAFGDKLTIVADEPIDLKNAKGRAIVMQQEMKGDGEETMKFKQHLLLFVSNGVGYGLASTTLDAWYPTFEKVFQAMAKSVEVIPATAAGDTKKEAEAK